MEKTIGIETYGCAVNRADSEYMAGLLEEAGYRLCSEGDCSVLVVNTCTVKTPTERKILKRLRYLEQEGRRVVVVGCMPSAQPEVAEMFSGFSFIGTNIGDIVEGVESAFSNKRFVKISFGRCPIGYPKKRMNRFIEVIPIASGCLGDCSYCITREARGKLNSCPMEKILDRVEDAVSEGAREIWITSQDNGAYGRDAYGSLPELLKDISRIKGDFKVRVGMMNPNHAVEMLDELIKCYKDDKVYKFLHIPLQSGDDKVLKDMRRRYIARDFAGVVSRFREEIPGITISTDVILGFPTEDDPAFMNTVNLLKEVKPEVLNISRFWLRPKTEACQMKQHPTRITKDRSRVVDRLFREYALEKNRAWIGWEGSVLVLERGWGDSFIGKNFAYKQVILHSETNLLGRQVDVRVGDASYYDLRADISGTI